MRRPAFLAFVAVALLALLVAFFLARRLSRAARAPARQSAPRPAATAPARGAGEKIDWPTFGFDPARSGVNPEERAISPETVGRLRRLWTARLDGVADSSPILLHDLATPRGALDVLYLTTLEGSLVALDAATGEQLWIARTKGEARLTNASPVADPSRRHVYGYGLDGKVHRYRAETGEEETGGGWPVLATRMPRSEKGSSALNAANGRLYVVTSGYLGDAPPYQGHLVTVDLGDGRQRVFNTLCSDLSRLLAEGECSSQRSGIWARAGAVVDPLGGNLFLTTGNGPFDAHRGGRDWGDSVLVLSPDGSRLLDSYTPSVFAELERRDADLGSTAPALLPPLPGAGTSRLVVQGGKDGLLRVLDRDDLSGQGGPGHVGGELQAIAAPGGCEVVTQPAVWPDPADGTVWLFVSSYCASAGYQARVGSDGRPRLRQVWSIKSGATSPVLAGGVLFSARDGALVALDPRTGRELWNSRASEAGGSIGDIHWESPIVVNGRLFCSDQSRRVTAYGLGP